MATDARPGARAVHGKGTNGPVGRRCLHILDEDGRPPGRQTLCRAVMASPVVLDPISVPLEGYRWCYECIGRLADQQDVLGALAVLLAAGLTQELRRIAGEASGDH